MATKGNPIPRTKKNYRPTKSGAGMTKNGVAAYRRANPWSQTKNSCDRKSEAWIESCKSQKIILR